MSDKVTAWLESVVVHAPTAQGTVFEPNEAIVPFELREFAVRPRDELVNDNSLRVVLGLRPDPDGLYQLWRRKQDVELQSDVADQAVTLLQLALKIRFVRAGKSAVAAYPITVDKELTDDGLKSKSDWILLLARGQAGDRLYNVRRLNGGGSLPPCSDPNIRCHPPRTAQERVICGMSGC